MTEQQRRRHELAMATIPHVTINGSPIGFLADLADWVEYGRAEPVDAPEPPAVVDVADSLGLFAAVDSDPMAKGEYWPAASEAFRHVTEVFEPIRKAFGPRPFDDSASDPMSETSDDAG